MDIAGIVQKLWNDRNVLRGDGMSYRGDVVRLIAGALDELPTPSWE